VLTNVAFNTFFKSVNVSGYIDRGEEKVYAQLTPVAISKINGPIYTVIISKLSNVFSTVFIHFMILFLVVIDIPLKLEHYSLETLTTFS
jgi:hypothetical protein